MKYYAVAEINIANPDWVSAYVEHTTGLVERHGGRFRPPCAAPPSCWPRWAKPSPSGGHGAIGSDRWRATNYYATS